MRIRPAAFTLIECVLALGIAATVLVAVMGLLPAGLHATRIAAQKGTETFILAHIAQQSETARPSGDCYFDATGSLLEGRRAGSAFAVRVEPGDGPILPGDAAPSMHCLRVTISDRVIGDPFGDPRHLRVHHLWLAPAEKISDS